MNGPASKFPQLVVRGLEFFKRGVLLGRFLVFVSICVREAEEGEACDEGGDVLCAHDAKIVVIRISF